MPAKSLKQRRFFQMIKGIKSGTTKTYNLRLKAIAKSITDEQIDDYIKEGNKKTIMKKSELKLMIITILKELLLKLDNTTPITKQKVVNQTLPYRQVYVDCVFENCTNLGAFIEGKNTVWKSGTWNNGVWFNGTWLNGIWKNGRWAQGVWKKGTWLDGQWSGGTWLTGTWNKGIWQDGTWLKGLWKNGYWQNGTWKDGVWENGTWFNGTFKKGLWKNGDWSKGIWLNGTWKGGRQKYINKWLKTSEDPSKKLSQHAF